MHPDSYTIADTLEARADADDPLAPAEMHAMALAMRQIGDDLKRMSEGWDMLIEASRDLKGTVSRGWVPTVINGDKAAVAWDFSRENVAP